MNTRHAGKDRYIQFRVNSYLRRQIFNYLRKTKKYENQSEMMRDLVRREVESG